VLRITGFFVLSLIPVLIAGVFLFDDDALGAIVLAFLALVPLAPISITLLIFWIVAVVPLLFVHLLSFLLMIAELIVRRIAESPKGPIVATSALAGALVAIAKAFKLV
jgi:hypothetical protein